MSAMELCIPIETRHVTREGNAQTTALLGDTFYILGWRRHVFFEKDGLIKYYEGVLYYVVVF
jgi:hypothetical protein